MLKQLKYKNQEIPAYFIDENGKIYNSDGIEQEQKIYSSYPYYRFKSNAVHIMMAHSFFGYKPGFDVHHINENKLDNRLSNLVYLTHEEHLSLHKKNKKLSDETKEKMRVAHQGKKFSAEHKAKLSNAHQGKKFSAEHKAKLSNAHWKKVFCVELNKVFDSIKQASQELSLNPSNITLCCKGKYQHTGRLPFQILSENNFE